MTDTIQVIQPPAARVTVVSVPVAGVTTVQAGYVGQTNVAVPEPQTTVVTPAQSISLQIQPPAQQVTQLAVGQGPAGPKGNTGPSLSESDILAVASEVAPMIDSVVAEAIGSSLDFVSVYTLST